MYVNMLLKANKTKYDKNGNSIDRNAMVFFFNPKEATLPLNCQTQVYFYLMFIALR